MRPSRLLRRISLAAFLATGIAVAAAAGAHSESATAVILRRIANRYALTKARIAALLDQRLHPSALPANLPNPFFRGPEVATVTTSVPEPDALPEPAMVSAPAVPAVSDDDLLTKFAAELKISGYIEINGSPRVTLNSKIWKVDDVIPYGPAGHQVYIKIDQITPKQMTLRLNTITRVVRMPR